MFFLEQKFKYYFEVFSAMMNVGEAAKDAMDLMSRLKAPIKSFRTYERKIGMPLIEILTNLKTIRTVVKDKKFIELDDEGERWSRMNTDRFTGDKRDCYYYTGVTTVENNYQLMLFSYIGKSVL